MIKTIQYIKYYQTYKDRIFTYFMYRVGFQAHLAEDLTADVFLKAYEAYDQFDVDRSFQSWIYRIAHNHLVNYYRSRKQVLSLDDIDETHKITNNLIEEDLLDQIADRQTLQKKLDLLSNTERHIVLLHYIDGFSYKEISEILGKTPGSLRVVVARAKKKML